LITIVILGTAFTALLGGIANGMMTSDVNRKQAESSALLRSYAESVPYIPCGGTVPITSPVSIPVDYQLLPVVIKHLDSTGAFVLDSGGCPPLDRGVALLTISIGSTDQRATESLDVVKRDLAR
jgi:hypothetical protein